MELIFWSAAILLLSNYLLYPAVIFIIARFFPKNHEIRDIEPSVSFIIAAYNESEVIASKIENTLALDYPQSKLEIIVVTDGSTDATPAISRRYTDRGVMTLHRPERKGKTAALNHAAGSATGEIMIFSDANNQFNLDAVRKLTRHFHDPSIGGVCGVKHIRASRNRASSTGDGIFWKYESFVKKTESAAGSIAGADGEIFAMRRSLYAPIDEKVINDDQAITISIVRKRYRVIYETEAVSTEYASITLRDDMNVKVRLVAGGLQVYSKYRGYLFNLFRLFPLQFFFHKLLRYLLPHLMLVLFFTNLFLAGMLLYRLILAVQVTFYTAAVAGLLLYKLKREIKLLYIPFYFCSMNAAAFQGFLAFLRLRRSSITTVWRKAQR